MKLIDSLDLLCCRCMMLRIDGAQSNQKKLLNKDEYINYTLQSETFCRSCSFLISNLNTFNVFLPYH